jgi:hypothetical protein
MDTREIIKSQYYASLEMLKQAICKCPESLWNNEDAKNKFWHTAYHALFYTHLYLQETEKEFIPWVKHRDLHQFLGPLPWPPHDKPKIGEPYNRDEILEYLALCQEEVDKQITSLKLDAESGFRWLPFNKLELQLYNIRHIQHHTGQLYDRLGAQEHMDLVWVALRPDTMKN